VAHNPIFDNYSKKLSVDSAAVCFGQNIIKKICGYLTLAVLSLVNQPHCLVNFLKDHRLIYFPTFAAYIINN